MKMIISNVSSSEKCTAKKIQKYNFSANEKYLLYYLAGLTG